LPDSGYGASSVPINEWRDLPASYHNDSGAFSFADGHAAMHRWQDHVTQQPSVVYPVNIFPLQVPTTSATAQADFEWVIDHMSVEN
jgi:prepilin-type processing-associated H-X9-DG protein